MQLIWGCQKCFELEQSIRLSSYQNGTNRLGTADTDHDSINVPSDEDHKELQYNSVHFRIITEHSLTT